MYLWIIKVCERCSAQTLTDYKDEQANISEMVVACMIAVLSQSMLHCCINSLLLILNSLGLALFV